MSVSLLIRGLRMAARALPGSAGGTIVYARGAQTVSVSATYGRSEFQTDTASGVVIEHNDRDFLIEASQLILGGVAAIPQRGDVITADEKTYEVLAPGNAQVYRTCDQFDELFRVHTKRRNA